MARRKAASEVKLTDEERCVLERLGRRRKVSRGDAQRADIVLRAADGLSNCVIADAVDVTRQTVRIWRDRFAEHRLGGLNDEPRCGAPRKIGDDRIEAIVVCVDKKSQIQALDRTQPVLPSCRRRASGTMRMGQVERRTHDYDRVDAEHGVAMTAQRHCSQASSPQ